MSGIMNWTMKGRNGKRSVWEKPVENWTKDERVQKYSTITTYYSSYSI